MHDPIREDQFQRREGSRPRVLVTGGFGYLLSAGLERLADARPRFESFDDIDKPLAVRFTRLLPGPQDLSEEPREWRVLVIPTFAMDGDRLQSRRFRPMASTVPPAGPSGDIREPCVSALVSIVGHEPASLRVVGVGGTRADSVAEMLSLMLHDAEHAGCGDMTIRAMDALGDWPRSRPGTAGRMGFARVNVAELDDCVLSVSGAGWMERAGCNHCGHPAPSPFGAARANAARTPHLFVSYRGCEGWGCTRDLSPAKGMLHGRVCPMHGSGGSVEDALLGVLELDVEPYRDLPFLEPLLLHGPPGMAKSRGARPQGDTAPFGISHHRASAGDREAYWTRGMGGVVAGIHTLDAKPLGSDRPSAADPLTSGLGICTTLPPGWEGVREDGGPGGGVPDRLGQAWQRVHAWWLAWKLRRTTDPLGRSLIAAATRDYCDWLARYAAPRRPAHPRGWSAGDRLFGEVLSCVEVREPRDPMALKRLPHRVALFHYLGRTTGEGHVRFAAVCDPYELACDRLWIKGLVELGETDGEAASRRLERVGGAARTFYLAADVAARVLVEEEARPTATRVDREGDGDGIFALARKVAEGVEVEVDTCDMPDLRACLVQTRKSTAIVLHRGLPRAERAFSVCHELSHWLLGHDPNTSYALDPARLGSLDRMRHFEIQEEEADALGHFLIRLLRLVRSWSAPRGVDGDARPMETMAEAG